MTRRPSRHKSPTRAQRILAGAAVMALIVVLRSASSEARAREPMTEYSATVKRVIDGDTIVVQSKPKPLHVRLRCVDTPEVAHGEQRAQPYGVEAQTFTGAALTGKRVRLVYHTREPWDRYGRLLAYVFLEDGTLFNAELIHRGLARMTHFKCAYRKQVKALETEAKRQRRGVWSGARSGNR